MTSLVASPAWSDVGSDLFQEIIDVLEASGFENTGHLDAALGLAKIGNAVIFGVKPLEGEPVGSTQFGRERVMLAVEISFASTKAHASSIEKVKELMRADFGAIKALVVGPSVTLACNRYYRGTSWEILPDRIIVRTRFAFEAQQTGD